MSVLMPFCSIQPLKRNVQCLQSCSPTERFKTYLAFINVLQWRSQETANARAQHGHTTFVGSSVQNKETNLGGLGGMLPQEFLSFVGRFWGYLRPYRRLESGPLLLCRSCVRCKVTSWQTCMQGSVQDFVIITKFRTLPWSHCTWFMRIQRARLKTLCVFSARLWSTTPLLVSIVCKRACSWWGMASSCWGTCPSVPQPGYATDVLAGNIEVVLCVFWWSNSQHTLAVFVMHGLYFHKEQVVTKAYRLAICKSWYVIKKHHIVHHSSNLGSQFGTNDCQLFECYIIRMPTNDFVQYVNEWPTTHTI